MTRPRSFIFGFMAFGAGAILPFAFAPVHWFFIAFISPALLLFVFQYSSPSQAFWRGWYFGLGFFGVGASWVYVSIHHFGNANIALASFITLLFVMYLAIFPAAVGFLYRIIFKNRNLLLSPLLAFSALWVLSEWLRGWLFTGFPWLFLGDSQTDSTLQGFAPIIGVYGISFLVTMVSGCLFVFMFYKKIWVKVVCVALVLLIFFGGVFLSRIQWTKPVDGPITVSLIQGNISQDIKWNPEHLLRIMQIYKKETEKYFTSQIIVWPEAAIPDYPQDITFYFRQMDQVAKQHHATIITGVPLYNREQQQAFNGIMVLGNGQGIYLKRHLVPFGEYTPLQSFYGRFMHYFEIPMSNLSRGPWQQSPLIANNHPFAAFICYEIAYPQLVLASMQNNQFIVVVSDDSWFGKSMASAQQLQMAQMRALETNRYVLYSTNTGITAIINPQGQIEQQLPQDTRSTLTGKITPMAGKTPLMWWSYYPTLILMIIFLIIAFI